MVEPPWRWLFVNLPEGKLSLSSRVLPYIRGVCTSNLSIRLPNFMEFASTSVGKGFGGILVNLKPVGDRFGYQHLRWRYQGRTCLADRISFMLGSGRAMTSNYIYYLAQKTAFSTFVPAERLDRDRRRSRQLREVSFIHFSGKFIMISLYSYSW